MWLRLGDLDLFGLFDDFPSLLLCGDVFLFFFTGDLTSATGDRVVSGTLSRGQPGSSVRSGLEAVDWDVPKSVTKFCVASSDFSSFSSAGVTHRSMFCGSAAFDSVSASVLTPL